jgi:LuxR family transcriptional regulator, maltose regulon positive regulatory protein
MALKDLVIRSHLIPPRPRKGTLRRARIQAYLSSILDFPLTLVLAGTGYGKSTALVHLADLGKPLYWYTVTEPHRDPLLFLVHLISAFDQRGEALGDEALRVLEETNGRAVPAVLTPLLNALTTGLTQEAVLVIDDYHLVYDVPEIGALMRQFIQYRPPLLHIVISSRQMPEHLDLTPMRIKSQMATITHSDLAFTPGEIEVLFKDYYGTPITTAQAARLAEETEGWALAIQLIWQSMQRSPDGSLDEVLARLPANLEGLFDYLAPEVLARQPEEVQHFLLTTSILRNLDAASCNAILGPHDSATMLRRLHDSGLFVDLNGSDVFRYQRLFQEFLQSQLSQDHPYAQRLHRRAADFFSQSGHPEETIYHLLEAEEMEVAADYIEQLGPAMVRSGRLDSLLGWINRLPEKIREARPALKLLLGDILRLRADFDTALEQFKSAEQLYQVSQDAWGRSRALRGQAQVYLDTIRPLKADALLEEALRLLEPQEYRQEVATLLDQLAENKLNLGYPEQAQTMHREARLLREENSPNDIYLEGRAMLRTGRLQESRQLLRHQAVEERLSKPLRAQRFHRETLPLLSLICAMLGEGEEAERFAREGIETGRRLQSDFVEAVGFMRLGHALQLNNYEPWNDQQRAEAIACYQRSIERVHPFKVARVGVEPLWGLCRAYGFGGDLQNAEQCALRALEISEMAGDEWIGNLVRTNMGSSFALAGQPAPARRWLERAAEGFQKVGDLYGWSAAMLWQALNTWWSGDPDTALHLLARVLPVLHASGHELLLTQVTLIGLKDEQTILPLLIAARRYGLEIATINRLLQELHLSDCEYHPGFTLWVRTLGAFSVWRGDTLVMPHEWQREKARQLFQLFITFRGQWLLREQIVDRLWPDIPADAAVRNFKVALNALNRALEPGRPRNAQPFFILRSDNTYGINPAAAIRLDCEGFEDLVTIEDSHPQALDHIQQALALYEDDYLPDCRYEDWSNAERERLRQLYLAAAGRAAQMLIEQSRWDAVISMGTTVLKRDPCWEPGYRFLMHAYAGKGSLAQIQAVYNRCKKNLQEELCVEPSGETTQLLHQLTAQKDRPTN